MQNRLVRKQPIREQNTLSFKSNMDSLVFLLFFFSSEANQGLNESDNHDYNVLEAPEQLCSEVDEDNNSESPPTDEDPEMPGERSGFVSMEDNPAYAVPWKKKDSEEPVRKRSHSM